MLHEALLAAEALVARRISLQVVDQPWLNRIDGAWLAELAAGLEAVFVVEDHARVGALGDAIRRELGGATPLHVFGVEGWPACGTPPEALRHHRLDGASLAERIEAAVAARAVS
jgi:transketolase